jgi:5-methyltetrahydrofolate--homocysteine methyltransferase
MANRLLDAVRERILLTDGAMGTQLQAAGLESGDCGDLWNLEHPDRVLAIQRRYVEAGSDCLITNTFGATRLMLDRHAPEMDVVAINQAAARIARAAFGDREGFVLGDLGPFGGMMEPFGECPRDDVYATYFEQASALVEAEVDAIIIETQTVLDELGAAVQAARNAGATCVIASVAFDLTAETREIRTAMGKQPEEVADFIVAQGADIVALNCGTGIDMKHAAKIVKQYRSRCQLPVMAQPNAGQPVLENMQVVYKQTPEDMARDAAELLAAGPRIIGACCGSTPEHIRQLRRVVDKQ